MHALYLDKNVYFVILLIRWYKLVVINSMKAVKKTISIPEDLCTKVGEVSNNFSAIVTLALIEYLQHYKIKKAEASFGQWQKRIEKSVALVNQIRLENTRSYANRSH